MSKIRAVLMDDAVLLRARDIGVVLDYASNGGCLTRNFRLKWRNSLVEGLHYVEGRKGTIYLTVPGFLVMSALILEEDPTRQHKVCRLIGDVIRDVDSDAVREKRRLTQLRRDVTFAATSR